jgi:hypothetical protein
MDVTIAHYCKCTAVKKFKSTGKVGSKTREICGQFHKYFTRVTYGSSKISSLAVFAKYAPVNLSKNVSYERKVFMKSAAEDRLGKDDNVYRREENKGQSSKNFTPVNWIVKY